MTREIQDLAELTLETADLQRMASFYEDTLGLERLSAEEDRAWLSVGSSARLGRVLGLLRAEWGAEKR